ncbi:GNAT family N-acetyltransferase [Rossellomorea sp. AcN35-11]|nr:GNAT family N-acetyltransferase [Rossellomorea aquimaris]WJV29826.1 GNAT family N-acetyltransferase [Rossellomorea sp. AcN35-11]
MNEQIKIETIDTLSPEDLNQLAELLVNVVNDGASIGFLPPLREVEARMYVDSVIAPSNLLLAARIKNTIVGTVQVQLATKPNATHRCEIAKLMTHPGYQRRGIGRMLMTKAEELAREHHRSLIVLDTREGDPSNRLYQSLNFIEAGRIPHYAQSEGGKLDTTVYYYKILR